jgi:NAD(P) transhydrogenase subunit alpha
MGVDRDALFENSRIICGVQYLSDGDVERLRAGVVLIGLYQPLSRRAEIDLLVAARATVLSLDAIPRITRAQSMDVLSSQSSLAGYQAVLKAAAMLPRVFPMMMTAAGTLAPARVLVVGAGVAGLQAIATARRLGAVVAAFDTRSSVKEQVESLGAAFVEVEGAREDRSAGGYAVEQDADYRSRQQQALAARVQQSDVVITTALIPGRPAPRLLDQEMVESMRPGSVVVDMATANGGNCALSSDESIVVHKGVSIVGSSLLAAEKAQDASRMFARNVQRLLALCVNQTGYALNREDDIIAGCLLTHEGQLVWPGYN